MTSSELKKLRRKQRKAELKAQAKVQEEKKGELLHIVMYACDSSLYIVEYSETSR